MYLTHPKTHICCTLYTTYSIQCTIHSTSHTKTHYYILQKQKHTPMYYILCTIYKNTLLCTIYSTSHTKTHYPAVPKNRVKANDKLNAKKNSREACREFFFSSKNFFSRQTSKPTTNLTPKRAAAKPAEIFFFAFF